ncbi:Exopolyphosphatase [Caulifigura coniformis]|uniref:Exopolyphosphatase n=1 Tax=Caulifigura coniformis TaxID=2527983 RepID=A0A517SCG0_9PLAN|nr:Ppx/GppA phosphatase family protein [Caulifigura coniformis]QDT53819.1 Exopolyphosphatase [Caulifigura coniformis]
MAAAETPLSPVNAPPGTSGPPAPNRPIAVIDIGTSAIRMAIAEVDSAGQVQTLETLSQGVRLGKDTFSRSEISRATIEDTVRVLRSYRQKLEEYGITRPDQIRVVATSAVREAVNRLALLDRIYMSTGLTIEPIEEAEVHRITFRSIQPLLHSERSLVESQTIICEVGGGNTELLIVDRGNVAYSHSYRLGSLRLRQAMESFRAPQDKVQGIMQSEIERSLEEIPELIPPGDRRVIGLGGDLRFAARQLVSNWDPRTLAAISVDDLAKLTDRVAPMTDDAIVRRFHLPFPDAETLAPALMTYLHLARTLGASQILVSSANLRDGLLREMAEGWTWTEDFRRQIFRSAIELGRKYSFDEDHGSHVAQLSRQLFQALKDEHKLDSRYELILSLAATLHEIGRYVSNTSMHKHSMYLITNSDLFGLGSQDMLLVGLVARYHRRATPKSTHPGFNTLERDRRVAVLKMAAILRIAIALDASRSQRIHAIQCARHKQRLIITAPDVEDLSVEQLAIRQGSGMFEDVFGLKVQLRRAERPQLRGSTSQL